MRYPYNATSCLDVPTRRENIAELAVSVREGSATMSRRRQAGEEEAKAVQELVEQRKKEIQVRCRMLSPLVCYSEDGHAHGHAHDSLWRMFWKG
jgi:hypothetical protein